MDKIINGLCISIAKYVHISSAYGLNLEVTDLEHLKRYEVYLPTALKYLQQIDLKPTDIQIIEDIGTYKAQISYSGTTLASTITIEIREAIEYINNVLELIYYKREIPKELTVPEANTEEELVKLKPELLTHYSAFIGCQ